MKEYLENDFAELWIEKKIVHCIYKSNSLLNLKAAEAIVKDRIGLQNEKTYPVFCDTRGILNVDKDARDYLAKEGSVLAKAVAFLVNPPLSEALILFYIKTSPPLVPTKVFVQAQDALDYLTQFV